MTTSLDKVIIALDVDNAESALELINKLSPPIDFYKVGLELYTAEGNFLIKELKSRNLKIFLDLKLHDVPNTVAKAITCLARLEPDMVTVHGLGGTQMLEAASRAAKEAYQGIKVLAVTILTSLDQALLQQMGIETDLKELVLKIANQAYESGCDGLVCSAVDLTYLRNQFPASFLMVTPGIRLSKDNVNDQARVATPNQAVSQGANYLVIGRSITAKEDPAKALAELNL